MRFWDTGTAHGKDYVKDTIELVEQPLWNRLYSNFYHKYICMWLSCKWWFPKLLSHAVDLRCFEIMHGKQKTLYMFERLRPDGKWQLHERTTGTGVSTATEPPNNEEDNKQ